MHGTKIITNFESTKKKREKFDIVETFPAYVQFMGH